MNAQGFQASGAIFISFRLWSTPNLSHGEIQLSLYYHQLGVRRRENHIGKFGEHEKYVRVALGVAESNSSFLSASYLDERTLTYEPIVKFCNRVLLLKGVVINHKIT